MNYKNIILAAVSILILGTVAYLDIAKKQTLPIVAIANYGPHSSLDAAIAGMKAELEKEGFIEDDLKSMERAR